MSSKDVKAKARQSVSKPGAEQDTAYAGGNPAFDERKSTGPQKSSETVHAGGNPHFDERQPGKSKSSSG
ncbi:MAG: hypothetical protein V4671_20620 [Armatimonadota bacterium]